MRRFICIIALLCSIFVADAQLIIPVGKTLVSNTVTIKSLDSVSKQMRQVAEFDLHQEFTFVAKDSLIVKYDGVVIVTVKISDLVHKTVIGNVESYFYNVDRTFDGQKVRVLMGIFTDKLGRVAGVAVGTDEKVSFFIFEKINLLNN